MRARGRSWGGRAGQRKKAKQISASPLCDSAVLLDLVHALPHDHDVPKVPRQLALHLHPPEVNPIAQALERGGRKEQKQVIVKVEKAAFAGHFFQLNQLNLW